MIVTCDAVFGNVNIIIFQLVEWIAIVEKSMKSVLGWCIDMLGFSFNSLPTRHEVPEKPYLQEDKRIYWNKPTKLSNIADMAKFNPNIQSLASGNAGSRMTDIDDW